MSSITLLLLLCLSVHACSERKISLQHQVGENTMKQEEPKAFLKEEASPTSGDIVMPSLQNDLQRLAKTEIFESSKAQARFLLGSPPGNTNEAVDSKENDFVEDAVVMDYAQPHRKPPIHNEKP
ncbi:hypothetical protein WN944_013602 [Citrus x changshan-huyou]|uniref:Uncharacterized protein n=1 Tax=Citrus x changshan-huyou TaxID=2935761 RepID=A0AAP0M6W3_9ROSI